MPIPSLLKNSPVNNSLQSARSQPTHPMKAAVMTRVNDRASISKEAGGGNGNSERVSAIQQAMMDAMVQKTNDSGTEKQAAETREDARSKYRNSAQGIMDRARTSKNLHKIWMKEIQKK